MENIIPNPHDKFFKESFSRLEVTKSFIEEVFPSDIRDKMNLNSLKLSNASFIDDMLKEYFADLVYQFEYQGVNSIITLLFEHKSYQEDFPEWQLLRYMTNIWGEFQKQKKENKLNKPSVVIPIVIHHGGSPWKKTSMKSYFGNPPSELLRFLPEFDYLLFSLHDFEDHQIANFKNDFLSTAAMLLKHSRDEKEKFLQIESFIIEKLRAFDIVHENSFINSVVYYLNASTNLTVKELIIIFTKISDNITNIAMNAADEIREENTFNHVKGLIQNGVSIELISKSFGLSIQKVEEIIQKIKASYN